MEGWHRISALGGAGALGIRRGALPVLSTRFLDSRCCARCRSALEDGPGRVLLDCAHPCRSGHVPAGPRVAVVPGRVVCGSVLCAQSLPLVDRLLAERLRRTAGRGLAAASAAVYAAAQRARLSPDALVESHPGRRLADERTRGRDDPLLNGRGGVALGCGWGRKSGRAGTIMESTNLASPRPDGAGDGPGSRPRLVL